MSGGKHRRWVLLWAAVVTTGAGCGGSVGADSAGRSPQRSGGTAAPTPAGTGPLAPGEWRTAGCGERRPAIEVSVGPTSMPVTPPELDAAMTRIRDAGRTRFPDSYAGLEVDQRQVHTVVYRVPSAEFDAFLRDIGPGVCVIVRNAAHPAGVLDALRKRVTADLPYWAGRGIRVNMVNARHDGAGVEVGVGPDDLARARTELPGRYGPTAPLLVVGQAPIVPLAGRRGPGPVR